MKSARCDARARYDDRVIGRRSGLRAGVGLFLRCGVLSIGQCRRKHGACTHGCHADGPEIFHASPSRFADL